MNNELIKMMNDKLDELTARGFSFYQAKLIVAQAAVVMLEEMGLSQEDVKKFVSVIGK